MSRLLTLCLAAAAGLALIGAPAAKGASSGWFGRNLIVNGGAELGAASSDGTIYVRVPGWSPVRGKPAINVVSYGYDSFPSANVPGPASRGKHLFFGGVAPYAVSTQAVNLASLGSTIDGGRVRFSFSAYLGGYSSQADDASATLRFEPSGRTYKLGPVTAQQRKNATELLLRTATGDVPAGTRSATVTLEMYRFEGTSNDGYTDNVSLVLTNGPLTPKETRR
jgi:hypothetical protein